MFTLSKTPNGIAATCARCESCTIYGYGPDGAVRLGKTIRCHICGAQAPTATTFAEHRSSAAKAALDLFRLQHSLADILSDPPAGRSPPSDPSDTAGRPPRQGEDHASSDNVIDFAKSKARLLNHRRIGGTPPEGTAS